MDAFKEEQLRARGYVPVGNGEWKKAGAGVIERREGTAAAPQGGRKERSSARTTRGTPEKVNAPCAGAGAIEGRASATNDPREKMNGTESAFADYLDGRIQRGEIKRWDFEAMKFILADRTTYTPDFFVMLPDGRIEFYEVKGFMRDDANVKLKVSASKFYMFKFYLVRKEKREWKITRI